MDHLPKNHHESKNPLHKVAQLFDSRLSISRNDGVRVKNNASDNVLTRRVSFALGAHAAPTDCLIDQASAKWLTVAIESPELDSGPNVLLIAPDVQDACGILEVTAPVSYGESEERLQIDPRLIKMQDVVLTNFAEPRSENVGIVKMQTRGQATPLTLPSMAKATGQAKTNAFRPMAFKDIRTRTVDEKIASKLSLTRRRESALNDAQFAVERRLLASIAGVAESDIAWVGLFRRVPISAAQAIEIDERRGILSLTLKPNAIEIVRRQVKPVVNLAIGRNKTTGAIVQTLVR